MNAQEPIQNDEPLRQVLRGWQVDAKLPPRFQEGVWRQIERQETQAPAWLILCRRLGAALTRPTLAVSYVTLLLLAGLLAGYWQAQLTRAQTDRTLGSRYVQMVDPYQSAHR